jgi:hypothetical protein
LLVVLVVVEQLKAHTQQQAVLATQEVTHQSKVMQAVAMGEILARLITVVQVVEQVLLVELLQVQQQVTVVLVLVELAIPITQFWTLLAQQQVLVNYLVVTIITLAAVQVVTAAMPIHRQVAQAAVVELPLTAQQTLAVVVAVEISLPVLSVVMVVLV